MKLAVLGAGPGGYVAAIRAAQTGAEVTVIEDNEVGGTCLTRGCIPTKALVASAVMLAKVKRAEEYGIEITGEVIPNAATIFGRKDAIVQTLAAGIRNLFNARKIALREGRGRFVSSHEILVTAGDGSQNTVAFDRAIIATGSRPLQIDAFPFDGKRIISSDDAVNLNAIPKSLIIIGAGYIGCEYASIFRGLGSEVTILEKLPGALSSEDAEISEIFERELKKKKIRLHARVVVEKVVVNEDSVLISLRGGQELSAEKTLVSVGREFNSTGIGVEEIGIRKGVCGEIMVNDRMETNISGIYAIGDVTGGMMFAHVASRQGCIAAKNAMGGDERIDYRVVPSAIFTSPEIASVGLRERQANEKGIKVTIGRFPFRVLGKAQAMGEIEGVIKILSDSVSDRVLGVHIIGPHASDLIHEAALAIRNGLTSRDIASTIHAHPTLSEGLKEAAEDVFGEAIHTLRR
jgi:dihydrolipoamide dehydrogenase